MLARDALINNSQRLLETGEPVAVKAARRVREGAVGKGLISVSTSLAAYFIKILVRLWRGCCPAIWPFIAEARLRR